MSLSPVPRGTRAAAAVLGVVVLSGGLSACQSGAADPGSTTDGGSSTQPDAPSSGQDEQSPEPALAPATVRSSVAQGATGVAVDTPVRVDATGGTLQAVTVTSSNATLSGAMDKGASRWVSDDGLEPGTTYDVLAVARNADGKRTKTRSSFTTADLSLDEQTYPSVAPLQGETVGVGMPVVVSFDVPVTDRAAFEKRMAVETTPAQPGAWHWMSDYTAHWRPKSYWEPGTKVDVDIDVNGVDAGNGIYGQEDRAVDFTVGDAHVYRVDAAAHEMKVFSNGQLLRTIPVTTGKPGFTTRSGTKVIMEKFESKTMNSETVGIANDSAEGYNIDNVQYAMRLTNSGEFIHAAPWSVGSQGVANVSHGCTGMSTDNAGWLFAMTRRGDVVEYTGTDRPMTLDNGYGDWNEPFSQYKQASALG